MNGADLVRQVGSSSAADSSDWAGVFSLCYIFPQFKLSAVHKGNAVVQRARLDHLNGVHLRAVLGVLPRVGTMPPSAGSDSAGMQSATALANPLHLPDVPRVRRAVSAGLEVALAALGLQTSAPTGNSSVAEVSLLGDASLDALILAHASKAVRVADFVPLLLPYVVPEASFRDSVRPRSWLSEGVEKACLGLLKSSKLQAHAATAGAAAASASDFAPASVASSSAASLVRLCAPAFAGVAHSWASLPTDGFGSGAVSALKTAAVAAGLDARAVMMAARIAVIGVDVGPPLSEALALVGRDRAILRLHDAASSA